MGLLTYGLPVVYVPLLCKRVKQPLEMKIFKGKKITKNFESLRNRMLLSLKQIYNIGMAGKLRWIKINAEGI